jgi:hypothetical protein
MRSVVVLVWRFSSWKKLAPSEMKLQVAKLRLSIVG